MLLKFPGRSAVVLAAVLVSVTVAGCAGQAKKPTLAYEERPVELLYATGADRLDRGNWNEAVDYFREVERQHPYSEWSRRSILMTGFAHYQGNQYADAIADADRFVSLYPGNPSASYAYYLKAVCYFEQIVDVNRDQASTEQALAALREIVQRERLHGLDLGLGRGHGQRLLGGRGRRAGRGRRGRRGRRRGVGLPRHR